MKLKSLFSSGEVWFTSHYLSILSLYDKGSHYCCWTHTHNNCLRHAVILSFLHILEHWFYKDWPKGRFLSLAEVQIWLISLEAAPYPGPEPKLQSFAAEYFRRNVSKYHRDRQGSVSQYISVTFEICEFLEASYVWGELLDEWPLAQVDHNFEALRAKIQYTKKKKN